MRETGFDAIGDGDAEVCSAGAGLFSVRQKHEVRLAQKAKIRAKESCFIPLSLAKRLSENKILLGRSGICTLNFSQAKF